MTDQSDDAMTMHEPPGPDAPDTSADRSRAGAWRAWLKQGLRSAFFMRPDWTGLRATPALVASLVIAAYGLDMLAERLYIAGAATFYWQAIFAGWLSTAVVGWTCWLLTRPTHSTRPTAPAPPSQAPDAASLFAMLGAQVLVFNLVLGLLFVPLTRYGYLPGNLPSWASWGVWLAPMAWICAAQVKLSWQSGAPRTARRGLAAFLLIAMLGVNGWLNPARFWYPVPPPPTEPEDTVLELTQELTELQPKLLARGLDALKPQRPGIVDLYAITFAPYASQDVFRRESALVAGVMEQRFGAEGRTVQLVNNNATAGELPWATPLNLQRAIARAAQRMDRAEDVLFIHLTSHGGADGKLSADFRPMTVDSVTPQALKRWLDDAGVRYRVISVSACYSGSWVAPLAGDGTLVMTAADADHTSYGCGSRSPLTFFGKAMYDEELRHTWSFERAHAAARKTIETREREAGKTDGYSNPQIQVGEAIRKRLVLLEAQHAASAALGAR